MKWLMLSIFISFASIASTAQTVIIHEDFEDQNLTENPVWTGDLQSFTYSQSSGNTLLRLNDSGAGSSQLRTLSSAAYGYWEFYLDQDFPPSNNNRSFIFLIADQKDLSGNINGYAIRAGENSSPNHFRLIRFTDGEPTEILSGDLDISGGGPYQIRVERDLDGEWSLYESEGYGSEPVLSGSVHDNIHTSSTHFGFLLNYTTTRAENFYFDDITVANNEPFQLNHAQISASNRVDVHFNYPVDENYIDPENFTLDRFGSPSAVSLDSSGFIVYLEYAATFPDGDYQLTVDDIRSIYGDEIDLGSQLNFSFENPFRAVAATALSNTEIEIQFSEPVEPTGISDPFNYLINGSTRPTNAEILDSEVILLTFSTPFDSGPITIELENIESESGFTIPENFKIDTFLYDDYEEGDLILNEFMYRPSTGYVQYVEILNRSSRYINLNGWELRRRADAPSPGGTFIDMDFPIQPGEFIVITPDSTSLKSIYGTLSAIQMDNFPGYTITQPDEIRLFSGDNQLVDSLRYDPSTWSGDGVALERRDPDVSAIYRENWGESPHPLLGTPGHPNEVEPDKEPPIWLDLQFLSSTQLLLTFNERLDRKTATDLQSYSISSPLSIDGVLADNREVTLELNNPMENNQTYPVTVTGVSDLFGNQIDHEQKQIEYLEFGDPNPQQVVINEILYRRLQAGSPEFIELYNRTEENIDLSGWSLSNATGSTVIPNGTPLRANGYIVFTDTENFAAQSENIVYLPGFRSLSNSGAPVVLKEDGGEVIDSLYYLPSWGDHEPGVSLERRDPSALSIDPANWAPSESGSTPATQNTVFEPDITPPKALFANLFHPDTLEVIFNEFVNLEDKPAPKTGDPETTFMINSSPLPLIQFDPGRANRALFEGKVVHQGSQAKLQIQNLRDYQENMTTQFELPVAQPLTPGDVVFNEIMFDPIRDSRDNLPDQAEYLELVNRRSYAISLEGVFIHDGPDENGEIYGMEAESTELKFIPANGYMLLYAEPDTDTFSESTTAQFFNLPEELGKQALRFDRTTLSLTLSGREVVLADSTHNTIDSVHYRPEWHNPNIIDTKGISLERVNPNGETNDPSNWGSHPTPLGGTPGIKNRLFQVPGHQTQQSRITVEPNPFSPDGDGYQDNLFINYRFDEPDYMLTVRIYDRYGRLVRRLAESYPAGFEGSLIWDGQTDGRITARIGIYIIYVEAVNSSRGRNRSYKETVVLARKF